MPLFRRLYACILCACLLVPLCAETARSQQPGDVTWLYFHFPPIFMKEQDKTIGFGVDLIELLTQDMTEQRHKMIPAPPGRIVTDFKEGKNALAIGMFKSPEREKIIQYSSLPCRLGSSAMVAMRSEDKKRLAPDGVVSIVTLLNDTNLTFGYIPDINYGKLQQIISTHEDRLRSVSSPEGIPHLIKMIIRGRIDWTVFDPLAATYFSTQLGFKDDIAVVSIEEQPFEFIPGYFVGPKTAWGKQTMDQIDTIMRDHIRSGKLYEMLSPYTPVGYEKEFKRDFDKYILTPAQKTPPPPETPELSHQTD